MAHTHSLQQTLQISVAIMATLGTLLLGMGSDNVVLPMAAIFVAITSVYFTDRLGWIRLNHYVATLAAIGAVCIAVADFFDLDRDRQLLAIAYLLIYLQIVLMYQAKDVRIYWQLFMLSLLQVVVAAALNFSMLFGLLLIVYLFVALFAQSVFFLVREQARATAYGESHRKRNASDDRSEPVHRTTRFDWETSSVDDRFPEKTMRRGLSARVGTQGVVTLAATLLVFFLVPRLSDESPIRRMAVQRMVGFSERVTLGELGTALSNPASVMRVRLVDARSGEPYTVRASPLFRGTVVNHYERSVWSLKFQTPGAPIPLQPLRPLQATHPSIVYQEMELEPSLTRTLFSIAPAVARSRNPRVAYDANRQQLIRLGALGTKLYLTLATRGYRFGMQGAVRPVDAAYDRIDTQDLLQLPSSTGGVDPLQSLKQAARDVLDQADLSASDRVGHARALEHYLRNSGRFRYSLTAPARDRSLDPVEDFIRNNPQGHCEYFASALTLMLRSQGIPARMVIGFKGGDFNSLGGYYQVRQLHAHTWVEALIERKSVPQSTPLFPGDDPRYVWLRLDPTTAASEEVAATSPWVDRFREWRDYSDFLWSNYIVELNARRQTEGIYEPLAAGGESLGKIFSKSFWTESIPKYMMSVVTGDVGTGDVEKETTAAWFGWRGMLVLVIGLLVALGGWRLVVRVQRFLRSMGSRWGWSGQAGSPSSVGFYRRFEKLLRPHGLVRSLGQTPREFARATADRMAHNPHQQAASYLPGEIVDQLYRVRFGHKVLDKGEVEAVEQSLCQLKRALQVNG